MKLTIELLNKVILKSKQSIILANPTYRNKYSNQYLNNSRDTILNFESEELYNLLDLIFVNQSVTVNKACCDRIDHIRIPSLGNLVRNPIRTEIIDRINDGEIITKKEVDVIVESYINKKRLLKKEQIIDISKYLEDNQDE